MLSATASNNSNNNNNNNNNNRHQQIPTQLMASPLIRDAPGPFSAEVGGLAGFLHQRQAKRARTTERCVQEEGEEEEEKEDENNMGVAINMDTVTGR